MESLRGFVRRHKGLSREAFVKAFAHPFLASPPSKGSREEDPETLFPGAWVIPVAKRKEGNRLDARISLGRGGYEDIWIDDASVSKEHCWFQEDEGHMQIVDANSTNGTYVNGHPLNPHVPLTLRPGDRVGIGEKIVFHFFPAAELYDLLFQQKK